MLCTHIILWLSVEELGMQSGSRNKTRSQSFQVLLNSASLYLHHTILEQIIRIMYAYIAHYNIRSPKRRLLFRVHFFMATEYLYNYVIALRTWFSGEDNKMKNSRFS